MGISKEIIEILDYLGEKMGITIDWTANNVLPYLEALCEKFIRWEVGTSITWIAIMIVSVIIGFIFFKVCDGDVDSFVGMIFWCIVIAAVIVIGYQTFDIVECYTFPEKAIYDYIETNYLN